MATKPNNATVCVCVFTVNACDEKFFNVYLSVRILCAARWTIFTLVCSGARVTERYSLSSLRYGVSCCCARSIKPVPYRVYGLLYVLRVRRSSREANFLEHCQHTHRRTESSAHKTVGRPLVKPGPPETGKGYAGLHLVGRYSSEVPPGEIWRPPKALQTYTILPSKPLSVNSTILAPCSRVSYNPGLTVGHIQIFIYFFHFRYYRSSDFSWSLIPCSLTVKSRRYDRDFPVKGYTIVYWNIHGGIARNAGNEIKKLW